MLDYLRTEKRNPNTTNLDKLSIQEIIQIMNNEDQNVIKEIYKAREDIEHTIQTIVTCLKNNGRLFYIGAGTSGRLGILDAAECVPTFNINPQMVQGIIAGGEKAMTHAVEGAEDSLDLAEEDLKKQQLTANDFVLGIAASGRTPYVIGGLNYAKQIGAHTGSLSCNTDSEIGKVAEQKIEINSGPEVLTGSTRLKAGTAQKLVLNMISTISMIHLGKVFSNLMVDVQATNEKLIERSKRVIMDATGVDAEKAAHYFEDSDQHVKLAIVRILTGMSKEKAQELLNKNNGIVRKAIEQE